MTYRSSGETQWHHGVTSSISTSGALIEGDEPASPSDPIVVAIALPSAGGCLTGRGRFVRTHTADDPAEPDSFAIVVPRYRLAHRRQH